MIFKYREWKFDVDKESTQSSYSATQFGRAEKCTCADCKNFLAHRDDSFPDEVKQLFCDLGIDINKDFEVMTFQALENGLQDYYGSFYFIGRMIEGKDCSKPLPKGGYRPDLTELNQNFKIGFTTQVGYGLGGILDELSNVVKVDFYAWLPSTNP